MYWSIKMKDIQELSLFNISIYKTMTVLFYDYLIIIADESQLSIVVRRNLHIGSSSIGLNGSSMFVVDIVD
jgi:hypothetical protein